MKLYPIGKHLRLSEDCRNSWYHNNIFQVIGYFKHEGKKIYQTNTIFDYQNIQMSEVNPKFVISDSECEKLDRKDKLIKLMKHV